MEKRRIPSDAVCEFWPSKVLKKKVSFCFLDERHEVKNRARRCNIFERVEKEQATAVFADAIKIIYREVCEDAKAEKRGLDAAPKDFLHYLSRALFLKAKNTSKPTRATVSAAAF